MAPPVKITRQTLVLSGYSTSAGLNCSSTNAPNVRTLVVLSALVYDLHVEDPPMRAPRVVAVREWHVTRSEIWDDPKAASAHTTDGGGGKGLGEEVSWLKVSRHTTAAEVTMDDTKHGIVVIIPPAGNYGGAGDLNAVRVANTMLGGPIRDELANAVAERRRLDTQVRGHGLGILSG